MKQAKTIDELVDELYEIEDGVGIDFGLAWTWMRYAYGNGYQNALSESDPLSQEEAKIFERAAWAYLP